MILKTTQALAWIFLKVDLPEVADLHVVTVQFLPPPMSLSPLPVLSVLLQLVLHSGSPSPPGRLAGSWYLEASR